MTAITSTAVARELGTEWRRFRWNHPEWTLALVATAAWMAVFAMSASAANAPGSAVGFHAHHHLGGASPDLPRYHSHHLSTTHVGLMVAAMVLPTILPAARAVSVGGMWKRRQRGPALFATGYLIIWIAVALVAAQVLSRLPSDLDRRPVVVGALAAAAAWEVTRYKSRLLRACCRVRPIPPDGLRADRMCVIGGMRIAIPCVGSCWAMMLPMLVADHVMAIMLMIPTGFVMAIQRYAAKPRMLARPVAAGLLAMAVVVAIG